jgi:hypothetical protein
LSWLILFSGKSAGEKEHWQAAKTKIRKKNRATGMSLTDMK